MQWHPGLCHAIIFDLEKKRAILLKDLQHYLALTGVDPSKCSGHSFRIGGATSMVAAGMFDWEIQVQGRWSSNAYQRYIRVPIPLVVGFAKRMANTAGPTSLEKTGAQWRIYNKHR